MQRAFGLIAFAIVSCAQSGMLIAGPKEDNAACGKSGLDANVTIASCTRWMANAGYAKQSNKDKGIDLFNRALALGKTGEHDRAIADLDQAIRLVPTYANAYNSRGVNYDAKKDYERALADYSKAMQLQPNHEKAAHNRGQLYAAKGNHDLALADFDQNLKFNPSHIFGYYNRGQSLNAKSFRDRAIADFSKVIQLKPDYAPAYYHRGNAHRELAAHDLAIADYTQALAITPTYALSLFYRAFTLALKADHNGALQDYTRYIQLEATDAAAFFNRGNAHRALNNSDKALEDYTAAIQIRPKYAVALYARAGAHRDKSDLDNALVDYSSAILADEKNPAFYLSRSSLLLYRGLHPEAKADSEKALALEPNNVSLHGLRGRIFVALNDQDAAVASYSRGIELGTKLPATYVGRGQILERRLQKDLALADYRKALELAASDSLAVKAHATAKDRIAALTGGVAVAAVTQRPVVQPTSPAQPSSVTPSAVRPAGVISASLGRRVALVIGNNAYAGMSPLRNPVNDARAVAAAFRRMGFSDVIERMDATLADLTAALKEFGDKSDGADWAVVYYAGHGMEINGTSYLIPTDAKLLRDTHVDDEGLPLERILSKVEGAKKLRLVILDACRNNPFAARMTRTQGLNRSVGRGLARLEPDSGVLVAYAAKHGTVAEDGNGNHSPFAQALLTHMEQPGLELNFLFRKVRDDVYRQTNRAQEPFLYGSLSSEELYFRPK